jgi:hypothetical protein
MISESLRQFGLSNPCVTRDSSSLMISQSVGAVWAGKFIRDRNSLVISECLWTIPAVESMRQPRLEFVDDF